MIGGHFQLREKILKNSIDEFKNLLDKKFSTIKERQYQSLLQCAYQQRREDFIQYFNLISRYYPEISNQPIQESENSCKTLLMQLCENGNLQQIRSILQNKNVKLKFIKLDDNGRNCLFYALNNIKEGYQIINQVLNKNPEIIGQSVDKDGMSLLHCAILKNQYNIAKMLLDKGADPNITNINHLETPMHVLLKYGSKKNQTHILELINLMLENNAKTNCKNRQGNTPFDLCNNQILRKVDDLLQKKRTNSGDSKINQSPLNKVKGKSELARHITKHNNEVIKDSMQNKIIPLVIIGNAEDEAVIKKKAQAIHKNYFKTDDIFKNKPQKKKEPRTKILTPDQLKDYLDTEIKLQTFKIEEENRSNQEFYHNLTDKITSKLTKLPIEVKIFGSFATNLCLPQSDIDMVIIPLSQCTSAPFDLLEDVYSILTQMTEQIVNVKFIKTATVPIIKVDCTPKYNRKRIDITYQDINHNGLISVERIKQYLKKYQQLRPLVLIIKKFIYSAHLFDPYHGGISSYGLILMIVAYIQHQFWKRKLTNLKLPTTSQLLIGFLRFYGYENDYILKKFFIVDEYSSQYNGCVVPNVDQLSYNGITDLQPKLVIMDPLNNNNNVGRATHKIKQIRMAFQIAYVSIYTNMHCGQKKKCQFYVKIKEENPKYVDSHRPCCILSRMYRCTNNFIKQ